MFPSPRVSVRAGTAPLHTEHNETAICLRCGNRDQLFSFIKQPKQTLLLNCAKIRTVQKLTTQNLSRGWIIWVALIVCLVSLVCLLVLVGAGVASTVPTHCRAQQPRSAARAARARTPAAAVHQVQQVLRRWRLQRSDRTQDFPRRFPAPLRWLQIPTKPLLDLEQCILIYYML